MLFSLVYFLVGRVLGTGQRPRRDVLGGLINEYGWAA
jgi:hypothetical protein